MLALTWCSWCFVSWSFEYFSSSLVHLISSPLSSDWSAASNWWICMEFLGCHCWPCCMERHLSLKQGGCKHAKSSAKGKAVHFIWVKTGTHIFSNKPRWINLEIMIIRKKSKCPLFLPLVSAIDTFSPIFQANPCILQLITHLSSSRSVFPPQFKTLQEPFKIIRAFHQFHVSTLVYNSAPAFHQHHQHSKWNKAAACVTVTVPGLNTHHDNFPDG